MDELEYQILSVEKIAREYGHGELWDRLMERYKAPEADSAIE